jgi:hypothetical protein
MSWFEVLSSVINILLGGSLITVIATWKAQRNKANSEAKGAEADAEGSELDNVDKAVKIWRDLAECMEKRNKELERNLIAEIELLRKEVKKQNATINKILKILDSIDHDNLEEKIKEAKDIAS